MCIGLWVINPTAKDVWLCTSDSLVKWNIEWERTHFIWTHVANVWMDYAFNLNLHKQNSKKNWNKSRDVRSETAPIVGSCQHCNVGFRRWSRLNATFFYMIVTNNSLNVGNAIQSSAVSSSPPFVPLAVQPLAFDLSSCRRNASPSTSRQDLHSLYK